MRRERLYLADIIEAADSIAQFLDEADIQRFQEDEMLRSAVLHKLTVIGEAAARLPADFRAKYSGIPWPDIIGFRNIVVHQYFAVDWNLIWVTATDEVPDLRQRIFALIEELDPVA